MSADSMEKIPVYFDMPMSSTVHAIAAKKQRIIMMLASTAGGKQLPSYSVFDRKRLPKSEHLPVQTTTPCHDRGWVTADMSNQWL